MTTTQSPEQLAEIVERFRVAHPVIAPMLEEQLRRDMHLGDGQLGSVATCALHRRMVEEIRAYEEWLRRHR